MNALRELLTLMASGSLAVGEARLAQRLTLEAANKEEYGITGREEDAPSSND